MFCQKCGSELKQVRRKILFEHPTGRSDVTKKDKTKSARVWWCQNCNEYYGVVHTFRLVHVVE